MNKNKIRSIKTAAKGYAFIGINLIGVLIFWTIPLIFSFIISISKWDYSKGIKGIKLTGLSNYAASQRASCMRCSRRRSASVPWSSIPLSSKTAAATSSLPSGAFVPLFAS